jgi:hypothetical protein
MFRLAEDNPLRHLFAEIGFPATKAAEMARIDPVCAISQAEHRES